MSKSFGRSPSDGFSVECGPKEIWRLDKVLWMGKWSSTRGAEGDMKKKGKANGAFSWFLFILFIYLVLWVTMQRGGKSGKNPQMSGFAFPFNKLFTGLWNRREARESTKVSGGERKSGNPGRGREPGALAIDLFLLNLEQKNGRWNEKKRGKKGSHLLTPLPPPPLPPHFSLTWFMTFPRVRGWGTWARARVLESVRNWYGVRNYWSWLQMHSGEMANISSTHFHRFDIILSIQLELGGNKCIRPAGFQPFSFANGGHLYFTLWDRTCRISVN